MSLPQTVAEVISKHVTLELESIDRSLSLIRENLDLGRPDKVQLIFNRRVTRRTPSRFRTRVLTQGVTPTLHVNYKRSRIKQYHKEGRAIGFQANRRLLHVQTISLDSSLDSAIGEDAFRRVTQPLQVEGQRASALRYGDPTVLALCGSRYHPVDHATTTRSMKLGSFTTSFRNQVP
jgi:hypothetical protein